MVGQHILCLDKAMQILIQKRLLFKAVNLRCKRVFSYTECSKILVHSYRGSCQIEIDKNYWTLITILCEYHVIYMYSPSRHLPGRRPSNIHNHMRYVCM